MCAMFLQAMLSKLGCTSDVAENGLEAVNMLRDSDPGSYSLVLMDLRMPVMDGFEATSKIRQELKIELPIFAISADDSFELRDKCMKLGFNGFYMKPLKITVLDQIVGIALDPQQRSSMCSDSSQCLE